MNKLLSLAPWWVDAILAGVIVAALALAIHGYNRHQQGIGEARIQAKWDAEKTAQQGVAIKAQADNATETQRRLIDQKKVIDEQAAKLTQALADNDALRAAGQRLRTAQVAAILRASSGGTAGNPTPAATSPPADPAINLLADVQRRIDEATDGVAGFADASYIAGTACERSYEALTGGAK